MSLHLSNRQWIVSALADEIYGPGRFHGWKNDLYQKPEEIEPVSKMEIDAEEFYKKRHIRMSTKEEILNEEPPSKKYGVGMLFPKEKEEEISLSVSSEDNVDLSEAISETTTLLPSDSTEEERAEAKKNSQKGVELIYNPDEDETDALGLARLRRPRSMGITFVADSACEKIIVEISGARYRGIDVLVRPKSRDGEPFLRKIWFRVPVSASHEIGLLNSETVSQIELKHEKISKLRKLELRVDVRVRELPESVKGFPASAKLVTVTIVNDTRAEARAKEEEILFQSRFSIRPAKMGLNPFLPLPRPIRGSDEEEQSLVLLYRKTNSVSA